MAVQLAWLLRYNRYVISISVANGYENVMAKADFLFTTRSRAQL